MFLTKKEISSYYQLIHYCFFFEHVMQEPSRSCLGGKHKREQVSFFREQVETATVYMWSTNLYWVKHSFYSLKNTMRRYKMVFKILKRWHLCVKCLMIASVRPPLIISLWKSFNVLSWRLLSSYNVDVSPLVSANVGVSSCSRGCWVFVFVELSWGRCWSLTAAGRTGEAEGQRAAGAAFVASLLVRRRSAWVQGNNLTAKTES